MDLHLPQHAVPDRVSITEPLPANTRKSYAELDGPGCIRHIWVALAHPQRLALASRKAVIRIFFDEAPRRSAGGRLFRGDARAWLLSDRLAFSVGEGVERVQLLFCDAVCPLGAHRVRGRAGGEPALSAGRLAPLSRPGADGAAALLRTLAAGNANATLRRGFPDGGRGRAGAAAGLRLRRAPAG